jgi:hypothetical protein
MQPHYHTIAVKPTGRRDQVGISPPNAASGWSVAGPTVLWEDNMHARRQVLYLAAVPLPTAAAAQAYPSRPRYSPEGSKRHTLQSPWAGSSRSRSELTGRKRRPWWLVAVLVVGPEIR